MLLALVVALLMSVPSDKLNNVLAKHTPVFSVLAVEGFYDIMEYTVKIWILNETFEQKNCHFRLRNYSN